VALIAAAALALEGAALRRDAAAHPAPGRLVEVDGAAMHLDCRGLGSPTVLLEAGMGGDSSSWAWVQDEVAQHTRVCAYDRPGYGWSEATAAQRDPESVAAVAARLLDRAGEHGPYVAVGHSLGGHYVRSLAATRPDTVAAVALVDGRHHDVAHVVDGFERDLAISRWTMRLGTWLAPFGVVRAIGPTDALVADLPAAVAPAARSRSIRPSHVRAYLDELEALLAGDAQVAGVGDLGDLPLLVVAAGTPMDGADAAFWEAVWPLQERFAELSTDAHLVVVDAADHVSLVTDRRHALTVARALVDLVERVRSGT
jgi:pimeloyl-ACP methyl ester carboxylesterase